MLRVHNFNYNEYSAFPQPGRILKLSLGLNVWQETPYNNMFANSEEFSQQICSSVAFVSMS